MATQSTILHVGTDASIEITSDLTEVWLHVRDTWHDTALLELSLDEARDLGHVLLTATGN